MKSKLMLSLLAVMVAVMVAGSSALVFAQTPSAAATGAAGLTGTWEGKQEGLPSVVLRVSGNGDALEGQVDFYIITKVAGGAARSDGKMTVNMVNPHLEGNALAFQVVRVNRDGDPSTRAVLNFKLVPTGDLSARLERAAGQEEALAVDMARVQ